MLFRSRASPWRPRSTRTDCRLSKTGRPCGLSGTQSRSVRTSCDRRLSLEDLCEQLGIIPRDLLMTKPIPLRHIILFYTGHIVRSALIFSSNSIDLGDLACVCWHSPLSLLRRGAFRACELRTDVRARHRPRHRRPAEDQSLALGSSGQGRRLAVAGQNPCLPEARARAHPQGLLQRIGLHADAPCSHHLHGKCTITLVLEHNLTFAASDFRARGVSS